MADDGWSGVQAVVGSQSIASLASSAVFGLRCDGPGGSIHRSIAVTVDPIGPPAIGTIAGDGCINRTESAAGLAVSGTGQAGVTVVVTLGTINRSTVVDALGSWHITLTSDEVASLADGTLTISAKQSTSQGVFSPAAVATITKDTNAPGATIATIQLTATSDTGASSIDAVTRDATPTYQGVASAASVPVVLLVNGVVVTGVKSDAGGNWKATANPLASGTYQVSASVADSCGNTSAASPPVALIVDTVAPALAVDAVAVDNRISAQEALQGISIRGSSESQAAVTLQISSGSVPVLSRALASAGAWAIALSSDDVATLPDGSLALTVSATDVAGNMKPVKRTISKDTGIAAPTINPVTGDDVLSPLERMVPVVVSGVAEPKASVVLSVAGWSRRITAAAGGDWSTELPTSLAGTLVIGSVQFTAQATDLAGNVSAATTRTVAVAAAN